MKLEHALDEYGLYLRRRRRGEEGQQTVAALTALREFLLTYSGYTETAEISPRDLFSFLLEYYPAEEEPELEVARCLLDVTAGFARWLTERDERHLAAFAAAEFGLRDDLARAIGAYQALREHARRDDLPAAVELHDDEEPTPFSSATSGINRLARLDQVDYAASEEDYFAVRRVAPGILFLGSAGRDALGEGEAGPVRVPEAASALLKAGDTIHGEIAPAPDGWELLDVQSVRPGGYA